MIGRTFSSLYYRLIALTVNLAPAPGALDRLAGFFSRLRGRFSGETANVFLGHLKRIFPDRDIEWRRKVISEYRRVYERKLFALFYLKKKKPEHILNRVSWKGREVLDGSVNEGRGVLMLVPHYGDERSLHVILGMAGYPVHVITSRFSELSDYSVECRLAGGRQWNTMHFPDQSPGWIFRALDNGEIVHYGSTAYGGPSGTWIRSFGVPILVPSTPWKLSRSSGCSVIFASCAQTPGMGFSMVFRKLELPEDRTGFAESVGRAAEALAFSNPGQYEWKNLDIRHRETNTIARLGRIPRDERELEARAVPSDRDPELILEEFPLQ
ncbi:MAG: hypothetical protein GF388_10980 [Candidatus Aegiribacteria sp.]|nr:hypothetical protein [Candidatus Aegiribacteria sp.]MBD3295525.1 hypothetical protein [Candidatus Fermentibacteria bacterium]